jgi:excisionase family DNA binding protein
MVPTDTIARPYVTTRELSDAAQVSDGYIRQLILAGKLKAEKAGGIWLIAREDAEGWMQSRGGDVGRETDVGQETSSNQIKRTASNAAKPASNPTSRGDVGQETSSNQIKRTASNTTKRISSNAAKPASDQGGA